MAVTREQVMGALFARLQAIPGIKTTSRRMTLPGMVSPGDMPRLMLWEQPERTVSGTSIPLKRTWVVWIVVVFVNPDQTVPGATIINPILEAIEAALGVDDFAHNVCSLGGLVHDCDIDGTTVKETGDTDPTGLGGAVVPVSIMPP